MDVFGRKRSNGIIELLYSIWYNRGVAVDLASGGQKINGMLVEKKKKNVRAKQEKVKGIKGNKGR